MVTRQPCQCQRWPEQCWATPAGTRGLCGACMPGNCDPPRPVTSEGADVTHRTAGTGGQLRGGGVLGAPPTGPRDHVF